MDRVPIERERIFKLAMKKFNEQGRKEIAALKQDHLYTSANWKKVREFRFKPPRAKIAFFKGDATIDDIDDKETEEARRRFLVTVKASYWKQFSEGLLGREAVSEIIELTEESIDRNCDMEEWDSIMDMIDENHRSFIKGLMSYPIVGDFARTYMFMRLKHVYDLASSFLVAREEATHLLSTFLDSEDIFDGGFACLGLALDLDLLRLHLDSDYSLSLSLSLTPPLPNPPLPTHPPSHTQT